MIVNFLKMLKKSFEHPEKEVCVRVRSSREKPADTCGSSRRRSRRQDLNVEGSFSSRGAEAPGKGNSLSYAWRATLTLKVAVTP